MKKRHLYGIGMALLFVGFVLVEYYRPKPLDWTETLSNRDKIPYGTYVLYHLLPGFFEGEPVRTVRQPTYSFWDELDPDEGFTNYISVSSSFDVDEANLSALLEYARIGHQVFIAAELFGEGFRDSLGFDTDVRFRVAPDSARLRLARPAGQGERPYTYAAKNAQASFTLPDSSRATVLGTNDQGKPTFIRIPHGDGHFYLSSVPLAFSNYYLLRPHQAGYAARALSYLPVQPTYWDEYQKGGRDEDESIFRVLVRHEALSGAYYLALGSLLLFMLFESKRRQRAIPVREPPRNTTLDFVQVVGDLYYQHRNHKAIAEKKVTYLLEHIRTRYFEPTHDLGPDFRQRLAQKAGVPPEQVEELFRLVQQVQLAGEVSEKQLLQLNKAVEDFYREAGR
jgi:hypothetical protein